MPPAHARSARRSPRRRRRRAARSPAARQMDASSPSGSIAPALVAPAFATARNGRRPPASSAGDRRLERRRLEPQVLAHRQHAHLIGPEAERPGAACERTSAPGPRRRSTRSSRIEPTSVSRAQASAVRFAAEPPVTSDPAASAGYPTQSLNHPRTSVSSWVGPADSIHEPAYTLHALATKSPSAPGHVPADRHEREVAADGPCGSCTGGRHGRAPRAPARTARPLPWAPPRACAAISSGAALRKGGCELVAEPVDERVDRSVAELAHALGVELEPAPLRRHVSEPNRRTVLARSQLLRSSVSLQKTVYRGKENYGYHDREGDSDAKAHRGAACVRVAGRAVALAQGTYPEKIALPDGFAPEGIEIALGNTFYTGSRSTGAIWVGDLRTGDRPDLVPGADDADHARRDRDRIRPRPAVGRRRRVRQRARLRREDGRAPTRVPVRDTARNVHQRRRRDEEGRLLHRLAARPCSTGSRSRRTARRAR